MLRLRSFALPAASLAFVVACDPGTCQGPLVVDQAAEDVIAFEPLCQGANVDVVGDVDVPSQARLDTLRGCSTVTGNIIIHDSTDITDLSALATLQDVTRGYILLLNNSALTTAELPALNNLDTGFAAIENPALTTVRAPLLPKVFGDITLRDNPALSTVEFPLVEELVADGAGGQGTLILGDLPALTNLQNGFTSLRIVEGFVRIFGTGLRNFDGFGSLEEIRNTGGAANGPAKERADKLNPGLAVGIDFDSDFNIVAAGNPALEDFSGLEKLTVLNNDVVVAFNDSLTNFAGLDNVAALTGNVYVAGNGSLENFLGLEGDGSGDGVNDGLASLTGSLFVGLLFDRFGEPIAAGNDEFINLQGLNNLATLTGSLVLTFNGKLQNFDGLEVLPAIGGDLVLAGSQQMDDLKGALALTTITGNFVLGQLQRADGSFFDNGDNKPRDIAGNPVGVAMKLTLNGGQNGFDVLTTVNKDVVIAFSDLDDLQFTDPDTGTLTTVNGRLVLHGNASPDNLTGIEGLATLGGLVVNFGIDKFGNLVPSANNGFNAFTGLQRTALGAGGLHLGFNTDLESFTGIPDFTAIAGSVTIAGIDENTGLANLDGLNVGAIGGSLVVGAIRNGDAPPLDATLGDLTALNLNATTTVGGDVLVLFSDALTSTAMSVTTIGGAFELANDGNLVNVDGLDSLTRVGDLRLHELGKLETVTIPALATVDRNLFVVANPKLNTTDFGLGTVGGTVEFAQCPQLDNLDGLAGLTTVGVPGGGDLAIIDCDNVANTTGLDALTTVQGNLVLRRFAQLRNDPEGNITELTFASLTSVGGLEVNGCEEIKDLHGFRALTTVQDTLILANNPKLVTLAGLQAITSIGRKLSIVNNAELTTVQFDDNDGDRKEDTGAGEPDAVFEAGLVGLATNGQLGAPVFDNDVLIGGQTGVIEAQDNPQLDQQDLVDVADGFNDAFIGTFFFCGNADSQDVEEIGDRGQDPSTFSSVTCSTRSEAQLPTSDPAAAGEGEGEGTP